MLLDAKSLLTIRTINRLRRAVDYWPAWVSAKWSPINSFFSSLILIIHQYSVSKIHLILNTLDTPRPGAVEGLATGQPSWNICYQLQIFIT